MPGCWLQALGGCTGTGVALLLLSTVVFPVMGHIAPQGREHPGQQQVQKNQ